MEKLIKPIICIYCNKIISNDDIDNLLFMKIKEGGLIHWNCDDQT